MSLSGGVLDPDTIIGPGLSSADRMEFLASVYFSGDKGLMLGPYLAGLIIDLLFFGVVMTQFFRWQGQSKDERGVIKAVVYSLVLIGICYTIFSIVYAMRNFVYGFGTYANFADAVWMQFFVLGDALIATIAQAFYAERAFKLLGYGKRSVAMVFLALLACCIMAELGGAFAAIVVANTRIKSLLDTFKVQPVLYVWLSGQLAADFLITAVTAHALWKSKTGIHTTDKLIKRLVRFNVETQLPPTIMSTFAMSKPYIIGVLALLNEREKVRKEFEKESSSKRSPREKSRLSNIRVITETRTLEEGRPFSDRKISSPMSVEGDYFEMIDAGWRRDLSPRI